MPTKSDMADQPATDRFKTEMPQIPGVNVPGARRPGAISPALRLVGGLLLVLVVGFFTVRWILRPKRADRPRPEPAPEIVVPTPASELAPPVPLASEAHPAIAAVSDLAEPWSSLAFDFRNRLTGENVPALIIRLPNSSGSQSSGYWALSMKDPYAQCPLEYITDLNKLATEYEFRAKHPMVGNPCSRSVFDPLKLTEVPGNVWVRGAIVQGSDIRPPLGIEVEIRGNQVLATRME